MIVGAEKIIKEVHAHTHIVDFLHRDLFIVGFLHNKQSIFTETSFAVMINLLSETASS